MFVEIVWKGCLLKEMRKKNEEYRKYIFSGLWTTRNAKVWLYNHFMSYGELILSFFIEVLFWEHWKKFKDEGGTCLRKYSLSSIACLILICWLDNLAQSFECDWQSGRVAHSLKSLKMSSSHVCCHSGRPLHDWRLVSKLDSQVRTGTPAPGSSVGDHGRTATWAGAVTVCIGTLTTKHCHMNITSWEQFNESSTLN